MLIMRKFKSSKVENLLSKMTIEEKIGQINQVGTSIYGGKETKYEQLTRDAKVGSFLSIKDIKKANRLQDIAVNETRLGIPLLFAEDVVHGFDTIFPIPLAESCSWNPSLIKKTAEIAAKEASAAGIHWTFAPAIDVSRDPRWGRIAESFGEDPFLNGEFGSAKVSGFQGEDSIGLLGNNHIISCAKHFAGYSESEAGRDYNTVDISNYKLANTYLPPFKKLINTGVLAVMSAFNSLNGIPATLNQNLLIELLRKKMDFSGLVISDWNALAETIPHGYSKDEQQAVRLAIKAELDVDMSSQLYSKFLKEVILDGQIKIEELNNAVRRILVLKEKLNLFENPFRSNEDRWSDVRKEKHTHQQISRQMAEESIVLLKNKNNILPLSQNENVAFLGPLLSDKESMLDTWVCNGKVDDFITVDESLFKYKNFTSLKEEYHYFIKNNKLSFEGNNIIKEMSKIVITIGEKATESGEAKSKAKVNIDKIQVEFIKEISKINKNIVAVVMNGRPLVLNEILTYCKAIVETWHLGVETGNAILNILTGETTPSGKLTCTFPKHQGQVPIYYNHFNTGRPYSTEKFNTSKYIDVANEPEFPFGYGLSYTNFDISPISLEKVANNRWVVSVEVTNTGEVSGFETIQLYIGAKYGRYIRPVKELKNYQKVFIQAKDTVKVSFEVCKETLSYYDETFTKIFDTGEYQIMIGDDSVNAEENNLWIEVE